MPVFLLLHNKKNNLGAVLKMYFYNKNYVKHMVPNFEEILIILIKYIINMKY